MTMMQSMLSLIITLSLMTEQCRSVVPIPQRRSATAPSHAPGRESRRRSTPSIATVRPSNLSSMKPTPIHILSWRNPSNDPAQIPSTNNALHQSPRSLQVFHVIPLTIINFQLYPEAQWNETLFESVLTEYMDQIVGGGSQERTSPLDLSFAITYTQQQSLGVGSVTIRGTWTEPDKNSTSAAPNTETATPPTKVDFEEAFHEMGLNELSRRFQEVGMEALILHVQIVTLPVNDDDPSLSSASQRGSNPRSSDSSDNGSTILVVVIVLLVVVLILCVGAVVVMRRRLAKAIDDQDIPGDLAYDNDEEEDVYSQDPRHHPLQPNNTMGVEALYRFTPERVAAGACQPAAPNNTQTSMSNSNSSNSNSSNSNSSNSNSNEDTGNDYDDEQQEKDTKEPGLLYLQEGNRPRPHAEEDESMAPVASDSVAGDGDGATRQRGDQGESTRPVASDALGAPRTPKEPGNEHKALRSSPPVASDPIATIPPLVMTLETNVGLPEDASTAPIASDSVTATDQDAPALEEEIASRAPPVVAVLTSEAMAGSKGDASSSKRLSELSSPTETEASFSTDPPSLSSEIVALAIKDQDDETDCDDDDHDKTYPYHERYLNGGARGRPPLVSENSFSSISTCATDLLEVLESDRTVAKCGDGGDGDGDHPHTMKPTSSQYNAERLVRVIRSAQDKAESMDLETTTAAIAVQQEQQEEQRGPFSSNKTNE